MAAFDDLDDSHDPRRRSWVRSANAATTDFPLQNLPLGVYAPRNGMARPGVAIGDSILDLAGCEALGLLPETTQGCFSEPGLNRLLSRGRGPVRDLRRRLCDLLDEAHRDRDKLRRYADDLLTVADDCAVHLPVKIGNFSDFFAGIHHARAVGQLLTPDKPLADNYVWVPIGYHGRASSVVPSGKPVRRPNGQRRVSPADEPGFGPCRKLDIELEMGMFIGPGNALGEPIPIGEAEEHIIGFCLLNDWSARDIQFWEMTPLGPFLGKNFGTTVSPWIVTAEALKPFRTAAMPREAGEPDPLPYLRDERDQASGGLDIDLRVLLRSAELRRMGLAAEELIASNARYLYWTPAQLVAHHASGGCNLQPGDLIGTGTLSGPTPDQLSSLLELTRGEAAPFSLRTGETRTYLQDGDEIILRGRASRDGFVSIGFGDCAGLIHPAHPSECLS